MSRVKAALIHLGLSSFAILLLALVTLFYWYPYPFFNYEGVLVILALIILVDVCLGPIITFIVFKPGKPSLKFDLTVIAVIQIAAFLYGAYTIESQHPEFITYSNGEMITVPASAIETEKIAHEALKARVHVGPKLAVTQLPHDPDARATLLAAELTEGKSVLNFPEYYQPFPPDIKELARHALDIDELYKDPAKAEKIDHFLAARQLKRSDIILLRLVNHVTLTVIVLSQQNAMPLGYLNIHPG